MGFWINKVILLVWIYVSAGILFANNALAFDQQYSEWGQLLDKHIQSIGAQTRFDYSWLRQDPASLDLILLDFSEVTKQQFDAFNQPQQIAFLINSYNAFSLKLVMQRYPVLSFQDTTPEEASPYTKRFIWLFGKKVSLRELELRLLSPPYQEQRALFAINCLCVDCPNLQLIPYMGARLNKQLEQAVLTFLNDPKKNQIRRNHLFLSSLFDQYHEIFALRSGTKVSFFVKRWPEAAALIEQGRYSYIRYNMDLNESTGP